MINKGTSVETPTIKLEWEQNVWAVNLLGTTGPPSSM